MNKYIIFELPTTSLHIKLKHYIHDLYQLLTKLHI